MVRERPRYTRRAIIRRRVDALREGGVSEILVGSKRHDQQIWVALRKEFGIANDDGRTKFIRVARESTASPVDQDDRTGRGVQRGSPAGMP